MSFNANHSISVAPRYRRHTGIALTLLLLLPLLGLSSVSTALAQQYAPDARLMRVADLKAKHKPVDVPDDYVQTPFGYFPPACVHHISNDERILGDSSVQHANGVREPPQVCTQDNFTAKGIRVHPDGRGLDGLQVRGSAALTASKPHGSVPPAALDHNWIQAAGYETGTPMGRIVASWQVPQNPTNATQQVLYFFPAIETDYKAILQPVLGYYGDSNTWDLSSWNCCQDGTVWYSDSIPAKTGDQIVGDTYATCNDGRPCYSWNVDTRNLTSGQSVRLSTTYYGDQRTKKVIGGALEVYYLDSCDQYPPDGSITFNNIGVYDYKLRRVQSPPWNSIIDSSGLDVQCNYDLGTTSTSATIYY